VLCPTTLLSSPDGREREGEREKEKERGDGGKRGGGGACESRVKRGLLCAKSGQLHVDRDLKNVKRDLIYINGDQTYVKKAYHTQKYTCVNSTERQEAASKTFLPVPWPSPPLPPPRNPAPPTEAGTACGANALVSV
jgi:hypothetical protein